MTNKNMLNKTDAVFGGQLDVIDFASLIQIAEINKLDGFFEIEWDSKKARRAFPNLDRNSLDSGRGFIRCSGGKMIDAFLDEPNDHLPEKDLLSIIQIALQIDAKEAVQSRMNFYYQDTEFSKRFNYGQRDLMELIACIETGNDVAG